MRRGSCRDPGPAKRCLDPLVFCFFIRGNLFDRRRRSLFRVRGEGEGSTTLTRVGVRLVVGGRWSGRRGGWAIGVGFLSILSVGSGLLVTVRLVVCLRDWAVGTKMTRGATINAETFVASSLLLVVSELEGSSGDAVLLVLASRLLSVVLGLGVVLGVLSVILTVRALGAL